MPCFWRSRHWACGLAVRSSDPEVDRRLRMLRNHGQRDKYDHVTLGYCSRLDSLQAAVLGVKLNHLDVWTAARAAAAARYDQLVGDRLPRIGSRRREGAVHHIYSVRGPASRRDSIVTRRRSRGIGAPGPSPAALTQLPIVSA